MAQLSFIGGQYWANGCIQKNSELTIPINLRQDTQIELEGDDILLPGFTDFHAHIWGPGVNIGVPIECFYSEGVVSCVEPGHFGYRLWDTADAYWQKNAPIEVHSFASVLPEGLSKFPPQNTTLPENISVDRLVELHEKAISGRLLGYKVVLGWKDSKNDLALLEVGRKAADKTGLRLMVHISDACIPISQTANFLKSGDIVTHIFSGKRNHVLRSDGTLDPQVHRLREKGILYDLGHAGEHFSWRVWRAAQSEGISFDTMGSDIITRSWKNKKDYHIQDHANLFSAMVCGGMPLDEAIRSVTDTPRQIAGFPLLSLKDKVLLLKKQEGSFLYYDGDGETISGGQSYYPAFFADQGRVILDRLFAYKRC